MFSLPFGYHYQAKIFSYPLLLMMSFLISGCAPDFDSMAEQRQVFARQNKGDIHITAIQSEPNSHYINGILLAAKEINERPGKLLGRSVNISIEQDSDSFDAAKSTIRRIVSDPKVTAVLGHRSSAIAVPASAVYERSQIIFMPPFSTVQSLTGHGFKYTFRMAPNNNTMTEQIASVADILGYKKVVSLYSRDDFNREVAFLFEDAAVRHSIELVKRASFFARGGNYRPTISQFNGEQFDAVFIAAPARAAGRMAFQLREMGVDTPIIGSDALNNPLYTEIAGTAADKSIAPSIYTPETRNLPVRKFIQDYEVSYQTLPDYNAAQGYDSLMLLAEAIERADSTLGPLVQSTLHFMPAWVGVTGIHNHDQDGELEGKKYFFWVRQDSKWLPLPGIQMPYLIQRFQDNYSYSDTISESDLKFGQQIHEDDHQVLLLSLAQKILDFKRIGVIYEDTEVGRKASGYDLLQQLNKDKEIEIVDCNISFSLLDAQAIKMAMTSCYGKLSLSVDALLSPPPYIIPDRNFLKSLNKSLTFFKIPTISLQPDNDDPNISLTLGKRSDINLKDNEIVQAYNGITKGIKTRQFNELLKNFPEISVNLVNLQSFNALNKSIIDLSPDLYRLPENAQLYGGQQQ